MKFTIMIRLAGFFLLVCLLVGCSTHPCADISDYFCPGKLGKNEVQPYGGVCGAQNPIAVPGTVLPAIGAPVAIAPAGPIVPPPAPLPGVQLQAPGIPPLPPDPPKTFGP